MRWKIKFRFFSRSALFYFLEIFIAFTSCALCRKALFQRKNQNASISTPNNRREHAKKRDL
jgi:hypothetical protein